MGCLLCLGRGGRRRRFYLRVPAAITPAFRREERPDELLVRACLVIKHHGSTKTSWSEDWQTVIAILPTSPCNWIITYMYLYNAYDSKVICCV
jgi:hypothetical protein